MALYFWYDTRKANKLLERLAKEYPAIDIDSNVDGIVTNVVNPSGFRESSFYATIFLDDTLKRSVNTGEELTSGISLREVLRKGDHMVKKKNTDTLVIYKLKGQDTTKYSFRLHVEP